MSLVVTGDVHGKHNKYEEILSQSEYTFQLGDLGYNYAPIKNMHKAGYNYFGAGNHEHFPTIKDVIGYVGRYGPVSIGGVDFFWVGGAGSVDKEYRLKMEKSQVWPKTWFEEEELTEAEFEKCFALYKFIKPDIVITHTAPQTVVKQISNPNILLSFGLGADWTDRTSPWLEKMWQSWQPRTWVSGHMHLSRRMKINKTFFVSLGELETFVIG